MKGLLLKDFYVMRFMLILSAIITIGFCFSAQYSMLVFGFVWTVLVPISLHAYDVRCKWTEMEKMFPCKTIDLVFSNYLVGYIGLIGVAVIELLMNVILTNCIDYYNDIIELSAVLKLVIILFFAGVIALALMNPPLLMFNQRGYTAVMAIFGGIIGFLGGFFEDELPILFQRISETSVLKLTLIATVIAIPISVLSVFISYKVYIKKKG